MTVLADRRRWRPVLLGLGRFAVAGLLYGAGALAYRYGAGQAGRPSLLLVIAATAVVGGALVLVSPHLERAVDRALFGARVDGYAEMRGLLHRLATSLPIDEVVPRLAEAAGRTAHSPQAQVRLWLADGRRWSQTWPPRSTATGPSVTVGVAHGGSAVGEIEVQVADAEVSSFDRSLLDRLAAPAGLALNTVRLTYDLRSRMEQLEELNALLEASTARLASTRRSEQRRLQAEIDERVMPHLRRVRDTVTELQLTAGADGGVAPQLTDAAGEVTRALEELRTVARGVFPPLLADAGLPAALEGWLDRLALPAAVRFDGDVAVLREQPEVQACCYFCLVTALAGFRAAALSDLVVEVSVTAPRRAPGEPAATVRWSVTGHGTAAVGDASLTAVRDRVLAFDGSVELGRQGDEHTLLATLPMSTTRLDPIWEGAR